MKNKMSDEQIDQMLGKLVKDSLLSDEVIEEIADSPKLWRNVQRNIDTQRTIRHKTWFQLLDWQLPVFSSLAIIFCIALLWFFDISGNNLAKIQNLSDKSIVEVSKISETPKIENSKFDNSEVIAIRQTAPKVVSPKHNSAKRELKAVNSAKVQIAKLTPKAAPKTEEVKTEFIALSYSPVPESGHILKVKVPRSMMSSLGVTANVENSSELVNAEIIIGDDGLTHAIRFVQ